MHICGSLTRPGLVVRLWETFLYFRVGIAQGSIWSTGYQNITISSFSQNVYKLKIHECRFYRIHSQSRESRDTELSHETSCDYFLILHVQLSTINNLPHHYTTSQTQLALRPPFPFPSSTKDVATFPILTPTLPPQ